MKLDHNLAALTKPPSKLNGAKSWHIKVFFFQLAAKSFCRLWSLTTILDKSFFIVRWQSLKDKDW